MRRIILAAVVIGFMVVTGARGVRAQAQDPLEGVWQGDGGGLGHVGNQVIGVVEAEPEGKFLLRAGAGGRAASEVYMHIATANFYLLSITGPKIPDDMKEGIETSVTSKMEVIKWLKRSLDAVKQAHLAAKPEDMKRKVTVFHRDATVDGMYLRIL